MDVTNGATGSLEWPDYLVVGTVLLISASIGVYYRFSGGRQKTSAEYFTANRSMSTPLLGIALMVAFLSAITILGVSGENYIYGAQFTIVNVGFIMATPVAAFLYLPVFYGLQYMSVYEYLERRFGLTARMTASLTNYLQLTLYTGVVLFAPALALEATTGLSSTTSILLIGLICTFYSSIGGIKAVLATDVFQGFLMFASIFCIIGVGSYDLDGGLSKVWEIAGKGGRLNFFNFDLDPTVRHTWWSLTIGGFCIFLSAFAVNQVHVQRLLSAKSLRSAQIATFINTPLIVAMLLCTSFAGLVLYAWFEPCDPIASKSVSSFDQVTPYFAKIRMSKIPGLTGFFIAGVFSASLSTVSAMLNSLAAVAIADYLTPIYRKFGRELNDSKSLFFAKFLSVANGLLCIFIAFVASRLGNLIQTALAILGALGGPVLGLFSLGIFFENANEKGAVFGTVVSLGFMIWLTFGQPKPPIPQLPVSIDHCPNMTHLDTMDYQKLLDSKYKNASDQEYFYPYRISYLWYTPMGLMSTLILGYIASIFVRNFSKNPIAEPNPDFFTPIVAARMRRRRENFLKTTTSQVFVLNTKEIVPTE